MPKTTSANKSPYAQRDLYKESYVTQTKDYFIQHIKVNMPRGIQVMNDEYVTEPNTLQAQKNLSQKKEF